MRCSPGRGKAARERGEESSSGEEKRK